MPAPSLFCPHKRLVSVCPECGAARAGAATPMRAAAAHDVDDSWHRLRAACHARARDYIARVVQKGEPSEKAYWAAYDPLGRRGKVHSDEEDPATFRGGFYRAMVKMFDITIQDRKIQGYNGLADWEEMRDFVFRKYAPDALDKAIADKVLLIHGGNAAWPRQQIATDLLRSDRIEEAVRALVSGVGAGAGPAHAPEDDIVARLALVEKMDAKSLQLATKVLHVFAPARWPALTPRSTPDVGEDLGFPIPAVESAADYPAFAQAMREIARAKKHADLDRTDIAVADAWAMLHEG